MLGGSRRRSRFMRTLATDSPEPGALRAEVRKTLGVVSGAHIRGVCAPVQQVWRAGAPGWVLYCGRFGMFIVDNLSSLLWTCLDMSI